MHNITQHIQEKIGRNLHNQKNHPINTVKNIIFSCFPDFYKADDLDPYVSTKGNFDDLLIPSDHVSRSLSDTYYKDHSTVLRTHTTAHQAQMLRDGKTSFIIAGDCYRRDEIDSCHYPVFHQIEGLRVVEDDEDVELDLKSNIERVIKSLFGECDYKMRDHKFPFTEPSWEVDVLYNGEWLEVLGCGIVHSEIMKLCGMEGKKAWAFGMGLDRLAMILFKIPDIRLMWSKDERFSNQFDGGLVEFKSFSKYPPCHKDVSLWMGSKFCENSMSEILRCEAGDVVESVSMIDEFKKGGKTSLCYRITYRSMDKSLTNDEVNLMHDIFVNRMSKEIDCEVRD